MGISISAAYISGSFLFATFLALLIYLKQKPQKSDLPFFWAFILYAGWGFVVSLFGEGVGRSLSYWRADLLFLHFWALYLTFSRYPQARQWALRGFWAGAIFLGLAGLIQYVFIHYYPAANQWFLHSDIGLLRKFGIDPNVDGMRVRAHVHTLTYAEIVAMAGLFILGHRWRWRGLTILSALVLLGALLASVSRGPTVGYCFGLAVFLIVSALRFRKMRWSLLVPLIIPCLLAVASPSVWGRLKTALEPQQNQDRLIMWTIGARMIADHPWMGVGVAHVRTLWPSYFKTEWKKYLAHENEIWSDVHNLYFQQASERGLPGLAILLLLLGSFSVALWKAMVNAVGDERDMLLAAFAVSVAFLVMNVTESAFQDTEVVFVFYAMLALALSKSLARFRDSEEK